MHHQVYVTQPVHCEALLCLAHSHQQARPLCSAKHLYITVYSRQIKPDHAPLPRPCIHQRPCRSSMIPLLLSPTMLACTAAGVVQRPPALAPQSSPPAGTANSTLHSAAMNISSGSSCSVQLQEDTLLCEALPGYLADMSHCAAPPQDATWHLYGYVDLWRQHDSTGYGMA